MPEEKTTQEQVVDNALYHNRNLTLRELAFSNLIQRFFDAFEIPNPADTQFRAIAGGRLNIPVGGDAFEETGVDVVCIVGEDGVAPAAICLVSDDGGESFGSPGLDGGFTGGLNAVAIEDNVLLIGGENAEIQKLNLSSASWEQKNTGGSLNITVFKKGGGVWLAGGEDGLLLKSTNNGNSWSDKSIASGPGFDSLAYGKGRFVTADEDEIWYSTDLGESWASKTISPPSGMTDFEFGKIIFDGNQFLCPVLGTDGAYYYPYIAKSENGTDWVFERLPGGIISIPFGIIFSEEEDTYIILGERASLSGACCAFWVSYDGAKTWNSKNVALRSVGSLHAVAYSGRSFHFIAYLNNLVSGFDGISYCHTPKLY